MKYSHNVFWVVLMAAVACGQKAPEDDSNGGNGGNGPVAPSPNGGDGGGGGPVAVPEMSYLPLVDGSTFTYVHSKGWQETLTISATTYEGGPAFLVTDTPNPDGERTESIFIQDGTRVRRVLKEIFDTLNDDALISSTVYDPGFVRVDDAWSEQAAGFEAMEAYERTETTPADGTGPTEDRSHVFIVEGLENVTTNAGVFRNCLRVRRQRTWQTDVPSEEAQEKLFWFAPGVGKVQEETLNNGNTEFLEAYSIPGVN